MYRALQGLGSVSRATIAILFVTRLTHSLHCSSFLGLPFRILNIDLVKPKKGTTMETIGMLWGLGV